MPNKKVLIPLFGDYVAPRFDLAPEVIVATIEDGGSIVDETTIVLPNASAEALCRVVLDQKTDIVVCGAIDDDYFHYLTWKQVQVIDSVIGNYMEVLQRLATNDLMPGDVIRSENPSRA